MSDDWKGEDKIRARPTNNRKEATRMVGIIYHMNRRAQGAPLAAAKKHSGMMRAIFKDANDERRGTVKDR